MPKQTVKCKKFSVLLSEKTYNELETLSKEEQISKCAVIEKGVKLLYAVSAAEDIQIKMEDGSWQTIILI